IIVDFGDGADSGTRGTRGGFLLDGNGGREALNDVHFGAFHLIEELASVGGKRFDVTALALGVNGIEGERGFAGTGKAGDNSEGITGDFEADVLEVVLARAPNDEFGEAHKSEAPPPQEAPAPSGNTEPRITFHDSRGVQEGQETAERTT